MTRTNDLSPATFEWLENLFRSVPLNVRQGCIGVAVSGGSDSVALLRILLQMAEKLELRLMVLHIDHALRPDSALDAHWVEQLATRLGLPYHSIRLSKPEPQDLHIEGLESWARKQRLAWFARVSRELDLQAIAMGHHQGDQAETILWRLMRGSSTAGLGGLRRIRHLQTPAGSVRLWRPLLKTGSEKLKQFLQEIGQEWREDPTNATSLFFRNRIRNQILPYLSEFQPQIIEHLSRLSETMNDVHRGLAHRARQRLKTAPPTTLPWSGKPTGTLLRELLRQWWLREFPTRGNQFNHHIASRLEDLLLERKSGRQLVSGNIRIVRSATGLENISEWHFSREPAISSPKGLTAETTGTPSMKVPVHRLPLCFDQPVGWKEYQATLRQGETGRESSWFVTWVDAGLVEQGLQIGPPLTGDRFTPAGHTRSRTLARWFIDAKIPRHRRSALCVIAAGSEVLWVPEPGFRSIHAFAEPGPGRVQIILSRDSGE